MRVEKLYLSDGHNYFGHHGRVPGQHAITEVEAAECVAGRGVRGDRFFDYRPDYRGQITFFSADVFDALCATLQLAMPSPAAVRRNVVVRGADLNALIGSTFTLQGVRFEAVEECRPCYWMDQALAPGAETWLRGQGGLRCRILSHGWLRRTA